MKDVTLNDIAKATSLSKTTISRVLSGKSKDFRIKADTARLVLEKAKELGYNPDALAELSQRPLQFTIGLAVPDLGNPFFASLASIITVEAQKQNFMVSLFDTQEDAALEDAAIKKMKAQKVDGIIVVPCGKNAHQLEKVARYIPLIQVDRYHEESPLPFVSTNNFKGAYDAMSLLLQCGHRNIVCIQGPPYSITNKERVRGCEKAIADFPAECKMNLLGNEFSVQNGYFETLIMLNKNPRPTAIFAFSNTIMLGALKAVRERHLTVPDDISLISFDDIFFLDYLNPPVTRVAQPLKSIGLAAVRLMAKNIIAGGELHSRLMMAPSIVRRNSVKIIN